METVSIVVDCYPWEGYTADIASAFFRKMGFDCQFIQNVNDLKGNEFAFLAKSMSEWDTSAKTYMQLRAKLLKIEKIAFDATKGNIYLLETICPFCREHNIYPRFSIYGSNRFMGLLIHCKHCYRQHAVYIQSILYLIIMLCLPITVRHRPIKAWPFLALVKKRIMTWVKS